VRPTLALVLSACAVYPDADSGYPIVPDLPQVEIPSSSPEWTADDFQSAMEEALQDGFPVLDEGREVYLDFFEQGDEDCPGEEYYIAIGNLMGCTAESGYFFSGTSTYIVEDIEDIEDIEDVEDGVEGESLWKVHGDFLLRDEQDRALEVGGHIKESRVPSADGESIAIKTDYEGSWLWEGDDRWLAQTLSGKLSATLQQNSEQTRLGLDGAISFYETYWFFEDLVLESSQDCGWSAVGAVSLRDPGGGWSRLELVESCEPCGVAIFEDTEELGEACLPVDLFMSSIDGWLEGL
jgi:hypothetical protein